MLRPAMTDTFARVVRNRLLDPSGALSKRYPQELGSEIIFDVDVVRMRGRHAALLALAVGKKVGTPRVPTSVMGWGG